MSRAPASQTRVADSRSRSEVPINALRHRASAAKSKSEAMFPAGVDPSMGRKHAFDGRRRPYLPDATNSLIWLTAKDTLASVNSLPSARVALV